MLIRFHTRYLLASICAIVFLGTLASCTYDVGLEIKPEDKYNIDIGSFHLLPESIEMLPYSGESGVVFSDSLGNTLVMALEDQPLFTSQSSSTLYRYNVYEQGDTVAYQYRSQWKHIRLHNDSLDLHFTLTLSAMTYYPDPSNEYVADVLNIWIREPGQIFRSRQVFYHVLNQRTWPQLLGIPDNLGTITIFNKEFHDVLLVDYSNPISVVYFNYEVGIVSFTDHSGKQWRFERFQ